MADPVSTVDRLLAELVDRWSRGAPLDVAGLLEQAGSDADELAGLIDAFLDRAPRREPSDQAVAFVRSLADPPLLRVRVGHEPALKVDDVADAITAACDVDPAKRGKVRRYYQMLEGGTLDPSRVADAVWQALTGVFGRSVRELVRASTAGPVLPGTAFYRAERAAPVLFDASTADMPSQVPDEPAELDEVDRLFGVAD